MHLIIPFAAPLSAAGREALAQLAAPVLESLASWRSEIDWDSGDEFSLSPPHERALARWSGLGAVPDGLVPLAAWRARELGLAGHRSSGAWARLTPTHWNLATEQVSLLDPALLNLDESASRAVFGALQELFSPEGFEMHWAAPTEWLCTHESFADLPTASLDRVIGRSVDAWLDTQAGARHFRRLQNEAQMLLHGHALNVEREARGELPINSIWLSGSGRQDGAAPAPGMQIDDRLRGPALNEDWAAWSEAFAALEAGAFGDLRARLQQGGSAQLTLCGERGACTWGLTARRGLSGLAQRVLGSKPSPSAREVLERL